MNLGFVPKTDLIRRRGDKFDFCLEPIPTVAEVGHRHFVQLNSTLT
jgi:hypothetical protein